MVHTKQHLPRAVLRITSRIQWTCQMCRPRDKKNCWPKHRRTRHSSKFCETTATAPGTMGLAQPNGFSDDDNEQKPQRSPRHTSASQTKQSLSMNYRGKEKQTSLEHMPTNLRGLNHNYMLANQLQHNMCLPNAGTNEVRQQKITTTYDHTFHVPMFTNQSR